VNYFCHFPFAFLLCLGPLFLVLTLPSLLVACEVAIATSLWTKKLMAHHSIPHFHIIVHKHDTYILFVSPWMPLNIVLFDLPFVAIT
jgi:hypothetical protein